MFNEFNLDKKLIENLNENSFIEPNDLQKKVIPILLEEKSIVVKSETGSGKSLCFILPILQNIDESLKQTQAIIITPTKELAKQIYDIFIKLNEGYKKISIKLFSMEDNIRTKEKIQNKPQILISTIGKLKSVFIDDSFISTSYIKFIVLDEADMLLDSGFYNQTIQFINKCENSQVMLFSASIPDNLLSPFKKEFSINSIVDFSENITNKNVKHIAINIKNNGINDSVLKFLRIVGPYFVIIFCSLKKDMMDLYKFLDNNGYECCMYNGDLSIRERKALLKKIKNDEFQIVISSDLVSRGIDLPDTDCILSIDLPNNLEYYFHRAGRTGRFDKCGVSYFFYNDKSLNKVDKLLTQLKNIEFEKFDNDGNLVLTTFENNKKNVYEKGNKVLTRKANSLKAKMTRKGIKPGYKKKIRIKINKERRYMRRRNKI